MHTVQSSKHTHAYTEIYVYTHTSTDVGQWPKGRDHTNKQRTGQGLMGKLGETTVISAWQDVEKSTGREMGRKQKIEKTLVLVTAVTTDY